jgi:DNA replication and repair protein RecF
VGFYPKFMYLTNLSLTNFRNFARIDCAIPKGSIMLVGSNAQGKTSILEAIYFVASFTSFQAANDRQLINFVTVKEALAVARIIAEYNKEGRDHRLEIRIIQDSNNNGNIRNRKEILLDGMKSKASDVIGHFSSVIFLPQMIEILIGSPEDRRRFINLSLSQAVPGFAEMLAEYNRIIVQRNALLKILSERGGDYSQLDYWDEKLSIVGAVIVRQRIKAILELEKISRPIHLDLTNKSEILRITYEPSFEPCELPKKQISLPIDSQIDRSGISLDEIQTSFRQHLNRCRGDDIYRGVTTIGPHRDEIRFICNGVDMGAYGSRGQIRTVMLTIKLAEAIWIKDIRGEWPVLLLDEILAELDTQRRVDLLHRISDCEQTFLTTTDLDLFSDDYVKKSRIWQIQAGKLITPGAS